MGAEWTVECVLTCVEHVPSGCVVTYSDVAGIVGTSARRVGAVLSRHGAGVPWWRVVNAKGTLPAQLLGDARTQWRREGITETVTGCAIRRHRADLPALAEAYDRALETRSRSTRP